MKKRILTLLLAVITILQITPAFTLPIIAEGESGISVYDMEVGKLYRAVWDYDYEQYAYLYRPHPTEIGNMDPMNGRFLKEGLPQNLTVMRMKEDDFFVYATNEDWPATCDEYRYIDSLDIIILECLEPDQPDQPEPDDGLVRGEVGLVMDGEVVETLTVAKGDRVYLFTELSDLFAGTPAYAWQLLIDRESNNWATLQDYVYPYAAVSEALIANARLEDGKATLRCVVTYNGVSYVSGEVDIVIDYESTPTEPPVVRKEELEAANAQIPQYRASNGQQEDDENSNPNARVFDVFQVVVQYVYWNNSPLPEAAHGETAMPTFTATVSEDNPLNMTVPSTQIAGYKPYIRLEGEPTPGVDYLSYTALEDPLEPTSWQTHNYVEAPEIVFTNQTDACQITVYYLPIKVSFRINHYIQNINNDEYVVYHSELLYEFSESPVGENRQFAGVTEALKAGFTSLYYDPEIPVSANGNTVLDIYYDRQYFLIDFNLGDGGYGVVPLYVRYETSLQIGQPQRPGYTLSSWQLNNVYTKVEADDDNGDGKPDEIITEINDTAIRNQYADPSKSMIIKHNLKYTAVWVEAPTAYTIIYWLENPDSTDAEDKSKYSMWYSVSVSAQTGTKTVVAEDVRSLNNFTNRLNSMITVAQDNAGRNQEIAAAKAEVQVSYPFITYKQNLSTNTAQTVLGDGTTTVNVYFSRNEYTLRFYYARKDESDNKWYIAGMTDLFASQSSTGINRNDERELLNGVKQWGELTGEPTLKPNVATNKGYDEDTISYEGYTYKYFEFSAKYGADIGSKWPIDVLSTATRTSTNGNDWDSTTAVMSAWTGEYNVRHQHDNPNGSGNQTIKGKYEVLDEYLMWDPNSTYSFTSGWNTEYNDGTISFLCFWENAYSGLGWNVPELYRYKIWLPVIAGETYPETKKFNEFTYQATADTNNDGKPDYYLADVYDTCDNSKVSEQTQPALTGYTKVGTLNENSVPKNSNEDTHIFSVRNYYSLTNQQFISQAEYNDLITETYKKQYSKAYIVNFLYSRNVNKLVQNNKAGDTQYHDIPYGQSLKDFEATPDYPRNFEAGNYTFGGWYQDEACTVEFDFDMTMPDKNVTMYANWIPTKFNIVVYQEKKTDNNPNPTVLWEKTNVPFGTLPNTLGEEPSRTAPIDDYIFAGWYYEENGEEKRFDFNTMPIKHDYEIYAKWTSRVPVDFEVRYFTKLPDGTTMEIADRTTGQSLAGITKSFAAKAGTDLSENYRTGYFPKEREKTLLMEYTGEDGEINVVEFEYVTSTESWYRIRHVFVSDSFVDIIGTDTIELYWDSQVGSQSSAVLQEEFRTRVKETNVVKQMLKEKYKTTTNQTDELWTLIVNMSPDAFTKSIVLVENDKDTIALNEIVFTWSLLVDLTIYEVHPMLEGVDGKWRIDGEPQRYDARYSEGSNAKASVPESMQIKGYVYRGYATNAAKNYDPSTGAISSTDLTLKKATAGKDGLIIYMFYDRATYNYTVRYRDENGFIISHNQVVTGSAKYLTELRIGDLVKDVTIPGYELISADETVTLTSDNQVIDCVFRRKSADYNYRVASGSGTCSPMQELNVSLDVELAGSVVTPDAGWVLQGWYLGDAYGNYISEISAVGAKIEDGRLIPRAPTPDDVGKTFYFWAILVPTSLTIVNTVYASNDVPDWVTEGQGFIYTVTGVTGTPAEGVSLRVAVVDSVTIKGLPVGSYTVTVEGEWSWRYDTQSKNVNLTDAAQTVAFTYEVSKKDFDNGYYVTDQGSLTDSGQS